MAKKINKTMKNYDPKADKMVRAISNGDNVKAYKCLEQLVKEHVAKKIEDALED